MHIRIGADAPVAEEDVALGQTPMTDGAQCPPSGFRHGFCEEQSDQARQSTPTGAASPEGADETTWEREERRGEEKEARWGVRGRTRAARNDARADT